MNNGFRRIQVRVQGIVQGVGFRPHVFRLAQELNLSGWVLNDCGGVCMEIEGPSDILDGFLFRLKKEAPDSARIQSIEILDLPTENDSDFIIRPSRKHGPVRTLLLPDLAPCKDCRGELFDPANRRYRHPFISCTHCGPRYSIIESLPYDRPRTTLRSFPLCEACRSEYENPLDRRFHAQPIACHNCGPRLRFQSGTQISQDKEAFQEARTLLKNGGILALKALGGFQLIVDAFNEKAVRRLRERKQRGDKPFALLFPDLTHIRQHCLLSPIEEQLLCSPAAPIVLLQRLNSDCKWIAPDLHEWGVMLPATPLHFLLIEGWDTPLIATSGNLAEEPLCIDNSEARERLSGIADAFLDHDRPIARPVDDSVVRVIRNREQVLRRARGYAPLPVELPHPLPPTLALGGHLKSTIALASGTHVFISQHLGDLESPESCQAYTTCLKDLPRLLEIQPEKALHDLHPDYYSTRTAETLNLPTQGIQHHEAHALACYAENKLSGDALAIVWDGTGYGHDVPIWGGEIFQVSDSSIHRVATLRDFPLPGGDLAVREPRRSAFGLLYEWKNGDLTPGDPLLANLGFTRHEQELLLQSLRRQLNAPRCSSMGRLFDALAALSGLCLRHQYEGQAAILWEHIARPSSSPPPAPLPFQPGPPLCIDWGPALHTFLHHMQQGIPIATLSWHWHQSLAQTIRSLASHFQIPQILLSGGCFQNRLLTEATLDLLILKGFKPYIHRKAPPNDGGIAYGQLAWEAARQRRTAPLESDTIQFAIRRPPTLQSVHPPLPPCV